MFDFEEVEEVANHFPMCTEQPDLEQLNVEIIETFLGERLLEPKVAFPLRLSFDEDWPELSSRGNVLYHRFVDRLLMLKEKYKQLAR